MPPIVITIIGAIEMLIRLAPGISDVVKKARALIASFFGAGLITQKEQELLFNRVDAIAEETLAGRLPDWWNVEPDPEEPEK